jgi:hypothetical protein
MCGTNGIVQALLQEGMKYLVPHPCRIFGAYMAYGFIPTAWRQVKVTSQYPGKLIIPRLSLVVLSACRFFLLKTMEELVYRKIGDGALKKYPLHRNQHAYQIGKSTETSFYKVASRIESITETRTLP